MYSIDMVNNVSYNRYTLPDEAFVTLAENAIEWKKRRLGSDTLSEGFIRGGKAGSSEGDWSMLAEKALGMEDDYAAYARERSPADESIPTEAARSAITAFLLTGEKTELPEYEVGELAVNELIWLGAAERVRGGEYEEYLEALEARQNADGSFGMRGDADPDLTAMSLIVLPAHSPASERAAESLSEMWQRDDIDSCEAAAWCIIGLCAADISANNSAEFSAENGCRPLDLLTEVFLTDSGGFSHKAHGAEDSSEALPTEQALLALAAMAEYNAGGGGLFDEVYVKTDIYTQSGLAGEDFDETDRRFAEEISPTAAANGALLRLGERAELFGAEEDVRRLLADKLTESGRQLAEVERLNAETRAELYPPDEVSVFALGRLMEHDRAAARLSYEDRALLLAQEELDRRERTLIAEVGITAALTAAAGTLIIVRKRKKTDERGH